MLLNVKIKKIIPSAVIPIYAHDGDGCMDLTATSVSFTKEYVQYGTGLCMEIPYNYVGLIFPRSSISKYSLTLANSVGVIDHQYRGEIMVRFKLNLFDINTYEKSILLPNKQQEKKINLYNVGDRIAQIMIIQRPIINFQEVEEVDSTERGEGGFGSSGV